MADGEVSPVIHAGGQYVILKREGLMPARHVKFEQVAPQLEEILRDRKMRGRGQGRFSPVADQRQGGKRLERSGEAAADARRGRHGQRHPDHHPRVG